MSCVVARTLLEILVTCHIVDKFVVDRKGAQKAED